MTRNSQIATAILAVLPVPAFAADEAGDQSWANDPIVVLGKRISFAEPNAATATRTPTPIEEQDLQTLSDALVNISGVVPTRTMETMLQPALIHVTC